MNEHFSWGESILVGQNISYSWLRLISLPISEGLDATQSIEARPGNIITFCYTSINTEAYGLRNKEQAKFLEELLDESLAFLSFRLPTF